MTDRIAQLEGIIPVRMMSNGQVVRTPGPPEPEVGARWGRASTYEFSETAVAGSEDSGNTPPPPAYVRNSPRNEFETRVESVPVGVAVRTVFYGFPQSSIALHEGGGAEFSSGLALREIADVVYDDLGVEPLQEITGFTWTKDGGITERYRTVNFHKVLTMDILRTPLPPNYSIQEGQLYGEIP